MGIVLNKEISMKRDGEKSRIALLKNKAMAAQHVTVEKELSLRKLSYAMTAALREGKS